MAPVFATINARESSRQASIELRRGKGFADRSPLSSNAVQRALIRGARLGGMLGSGRPASSPAEL
jgi:hypothetical protein